MRHSPTCPLARRQNPAPTLLEAILEDKDAEGDLPHDSAAVYGFVSELALRADSPKKAYRATIWLSRRDPSWAAVFIRLAKDRMSPEQFREFAQKILKNPEGKEMLHHIVSHMGSAPSTHEETT